MPILHTLPQLIIQLYYSYIHSYTNYGSVSWEAPAKQPWKKINSQQKHALRIICNKSKFEHTTELFKSSKFLNVYKLNIFNTSAFMHKIREKFAPSIFFRNSGNPLIRIQRDFHIQIMKNLSPNLININMEFLTENHLSGIIFSVPWIKKSQRSLNLKLQRSQN